MLLLFNREESNRRRHIINIFKEKEIMIDLVMNFLK